MQMVRKKMTQNVNVPSYITSIRKTHSYWTVEILSYLYKKKLCLTDSLTELVWEQDVHIGQIWTPKETWNTNCVKKKDEVAYRVRHIC